MTDKTFTRFVLLPSGKPGIGAKNLAACFYSIAVELDKLGETRVKGIRIDPAERKLIVTLSGEDLRSEHIEKKTIRKRR